jgi:hypothetical protein
VEAVTREEWLQSRLNDLEQERDDARAENRRLADELESARVSLRSQSTQQWQSVSIGGALLPGRADYQAPPSYSVTTTMLSPRAPIGGGFDAVERVAKEIEREKNRIDDPSGRFAFLEIE